MTNLAPYEVRGQVAARYAEGTLGQTIALQRPVQTAGPSDAAEADPAGRWYTFEAGASKTAGGEGFADVWKMGYFAWEYKGQHADLDKA